VKLNGKPVTQLVPTDNFSGSNATGRATGGATLSGEANIQTRGGIVLDGTHASDDFTASAKQQLIVVDSQLIGDAWLSTTDTLSIKGVFGDSTIHVLADPDDVYIFNSDIHNLQATFGAKNNKVFVKASTFDKLTADGGAGHNTFDDLGHNTFGALSLTRFTLV
jgi:hypothetical protein